MIDSIKITHNESTGASLDLKVGGGTSKSVVGG